MKWTIKFHEEFKVEFDGFVQEVKNELLAEAEFVELFGPATSRPHVDTLHGSNYANMKELRFEATDGEWRVAFAFDPKREAILLVAGDKTGGSEKRFYKGLIEKADARFAQHLEKLKIEEAEMVSSAKRTNKARKS